jgi:hypothetical protein
MPRTRLDPRIGNQLGSDQAMVEAAAKLYRSSRGDKEQARVQAFLWLLVLAMHEHTIPSDVLDRMLRAAPTRRDQTQLVNSLRDRLREPAPPRPH